MSDRFYIICILELVQWDKSTVNSMHVYRVQLAFVVLSCLIHH